MKKLVRKYRYIFYISPCILLLLLLTIFPLIYSLNFSLYKWNIATPYIEKKFIGIGNYLSAIFDPRFRGSLVNTLQTTVVAVSIEFLLGFGLALCLNRKIRGQSVIRTVFLIPMMLVPVVVGMVWKMLYSDSYGVINYVLSVIGLKRVSWLGDIDWALYSVIIADIWQWSPLMFIILLSGLLSLPQEPLEAAKIDGASKVQLFIHITLPLLKPIIVVALLIRTIDVVKLFDIVWVLTQGGPGTHTETLSVYIYLKSFFYFDTGYAAALSFILLTIVIFIANMFMKSVRTHVG